MSPPVILLLLLLVMTTGAVLVVRLRTRRRRPAAVLDDGRATHILRRPVAGGYSATPPIGPPSERRARTLTDILEGIRLPYDLMPVTSVIEDADRHLIFLTTHSDAGEVGKRFAEELERLGFELDAVEFDHAVAVRGDDVVSMKIVPDPEKVEGGDSLRYGAAGPGDVALETWIGRSSVPPSGTE